MSKKKTCALFLALAMLCGVTGCAHDGKVTVNIIMDYQNEVVAENSELNERKTVSVTAGEALALEDAENAPYRFGGWFTKPGGAGEKAESLKPDKDITLYAYWLGSEGLEYKDGKVRRGTLSMDSESIVVAPAFEGTVTSEVAYDAFSGMNKVKTVHLPDTVTKLGDNAFRFCTALERITVPTYLKHIGSECFNGVDGLTSFSVPATCTYIGYGAFAACDSLAYVQFRSDKAPETPVDLSYGHTVILVVPDTAADAFGEAYVGLRRSGNIMPLSSKKADFIVSGGTAVRYIGNAADVTLPDDVTEIRENCFYGNKTVKDIRIPSSVTKVSKYAFSNCVPSLKLHVAFSANNAPSGFDTLWNNNLKDTKYETVYGEASL